MINRLRAAAPKLLTYLVLSIGALITLMPFVWMLLTSVKDPTEVLRPDFLPTIWRFDNYVRAMQAAPLATYFFNTVLVTVISTAVTLVVTILAAFGFSRLQFPGRNVIFAVLLATLMIPGEMLIITNFVTISRLGLDGHAHRADRAVGGERILHLPAAAVLHADSRYALLRR